MDPQKRKQEIIHKGNGIREDAIKLLGSVYDFRLPFHTFFHLEQLSKLESDS
jgi:hypothetical protein